MRKKHKSFFPKQRVEANAFRAAMEIGKKVWVRGALTAELSSDAHCGSGSGDGDADALIARDRRGHPVIWASHIEGVLRDAARRLHDDSGAEQFFGRAGGRSGDRQRAIFTSLYADGIGESHIWRSSARMAFDNRAPKDDTLRVIEYVPKGTVFKGSVELPAEELPVLQRLVDEVDALGSGRATGAGRVKLSLTVLQTEDAAAQPMTPSKLGASTGRIALVLKNLDPLCITATATPDNLIPSEPFVPGRTLLGAIAAWLIAEGDRETALLLTSGRVSVSDALPLPEEPAKIEEVEVLPAPLSLKGRKPESPAAGLPWWAQARTQTARIDAWQPHSKGSDKLKRPEEDLFVYRADACAEWTVFRPSLRIRLRNGRPDPKQPDASLFAIEQIVEKTSFLAELRGLPELLEQLAGKLAPILDGRRWLRVGRAGAPVEVVKSVWSVPIAPADVAETMRLTLTSDLLIRDECLRWRTELDETTLRELVGSNDVHINKKDNGIIYAEQDNVMIHGFNGTARLWRMPAAAIRRGSVYEISGSGITKLALRFANGEWLGERIHEGFGRFRLDEKLPGVAGKVSTAGEQAPSADVSDDAIGVRTREWLRNSSARANGGDRGPSRSQWHSFVAELAQADAIATRPERERAHGKAISERLEPKTLAVQNWTRAEEVLRSLNALNLEHRTLHARFFVRWWRTAQEGK